MDTVHKKIHQFSLGKKINSIAMKLRDMFYFIAFFLFFFLFCKRNCCYKMSSMIQGCCPPKQSKSHVYMNALGITFLQCRRLIPRARLAASKATDQGCWEVLAHPGTRGCLEQSPVSLCWFLLEELGVDVFFLLLSFSFTVKASQKKKKNFPAKSVRCSEFS